jgi:FkbM family methyltransferase
MLTKLIKFFLPHGIVQINENKSILKQSGISLEGRSYSEYGRILTSMRITGLNLLPATCLGKLKYVVDVGANTGLWSRHFLNCVRPLKLISFEPIPSVFAQLKQLLQPHPFAEARCIAAGNLQGTRTFFVTKDTTGASLLPPSSEMNDLVKGNWDVEEEIKCEADTLDHQLKDLPRVDLLKIDVQGAEVEVLEGASDILKKTHFLLIEFNYMNQYDGGSVFTSLHEYIIQKTGFQLHNISQPLIIESRAIYSDALYINPAFTME